MTDKKKLVYIAGPLTGSGYVSTNIHNAITIGLKLREAGYIPIIPHLYWFAELLEPKGERFWLDWDLDMLQRCDAMLRLPGESKGADEEEEAANKHGIRVYRNIEALLAAE